MVPLSLYLHIPFCRHRCGYCDFNTYAGLEGLAPEYVRALCREIELSAEGARQAGLNGGEPLPAHTVFFGGGTPSLLPAESVGQIIATLRGCFALSEDAEISLEANPGTLSLEYLQALRASGVNRLSLGVQSANPEELRLLERQHGYEDVIQATTWARQAGFDNFNLDLIFGLPHQRLETWQHTLELALGLQPEHFSLYALTLEHGTPLQHQASRGLLAEPDPDLAAEMYEWAGQRLAQAGYQQYEISNWAKSRPCRHNLQYWRNLPYLGFGAGAHGYAGGIRTANVLAPAAYNQRCLSGTPQPFPRTPATLTAAEIDREAEIAETMMMGLRLLQEGVSDNAFQARFGNRLQDCFAPQIERFTRLGLLEWDADRLRLTERGRLVGNQVFVEFI